MLPTVGRTREGAPSPHLEGEERVGVRRGDPVDAQMGKA